MKQKTLSLDSIGMSDTGLVREHNEDFWAAYPEVGLFILADGMGGHQGGEVASKEAVEELYFLFERWQLQPNKIDPLLFFEKAFSKVNTHIYDMGGQNKQLKGMGTTLCSLLLNHQEAFIAHVGDSRIYRIRKGELLQLTADHSMVEELLEMGAISPEEATGFPYKHILTRAIGTQSQVRPVVQKIDLESGDLFLLCSDGLTNYTTCSQIQETLISQKSLEEKGTSLIHLANKQGGGDNITLILVQCKNDLS